MYLRTGKEGERKEEKMKPTHFAHDAQVLVGEGEGRREGEGKKKSRLTYCSLAGS